MKRKPSIAAIITITLLHGVAGAWLQEAKADISESDAACDSIIENLEHLGQTGRTVETRAWGLFTLQSETDV